MKIFNNVAPQDFKNYDTDRIRESFLIEGLFKMDTIMVNYTHIDRMMILGALPVSTALHVKDFINNKQLGTSSFLERRELGVVNLGGDGIVTVDQEEYNLAAEDALYLGKGSGDITLRSKNADNPAKFYMVSTPAHHDFPTKLIKKNDAKEIKLGAMQTSNERIIRQYIHPDVLQSCQLCLGITALSEGSVWNTMPAHTHERRMEAYLYFDLNPEQIVFHYMGEPAQTRHIVVQNENAVLSPSWSLHSGCGTSNYKFIWAMAGENQTFDDMDFIANTDLR